VISSIPVLRAELHVTAINLHSKKRSKSADILPTNQMFSFDTKKSLAPRTKCRINIRRVIKKLYIYCSPCKGHYE